MVPRCIYYVLGNEVGRVCINIDWDLGFDREAKRTYIERLHAPLKSTFPDARIEEVTTASPTEGRKLSPIFMQFTRDESLEDAWKRIKSNEECIMYDKFRWEYPCTGLEFIHFYCWYGRNYLPLIRKIDMFSDVFYNPTKPGGTQAVACAALKLLDMQGNLDVLHDTSKFQEWFEKYVKT